jgi:hypothetical protein
LKFKKFSEKNGIFELAKFSRKSLEKVRVLFKNVRLFQKFQKKYVKFEFLSQKTLFLGQKFGDFEKSLEKSLEKVWKVRKQGFPNVWKFRKLFFSEISENYEKMTLNSNFGNRGKRIPT